jgi:hypothetical protein
MDIPKRSSRVEMDKMRFVKMDLEDSPRDDGLDEVAPGTDGSNASFSAIFQLVVNRMVVRVRVQSIWSLTSFV